jgi:hypothetical protein
VARVGASITESRVMCSCESPFLIVYTILF